MGVGRALVPDPAAGTGTGTDTRGRAGAAGMCGVLVSAPGGGRAVMASGEGTPAPPAPGTPAPAPPAPGTPAPAPPAPGTPVPSMVCAAPPGTGRLRGRIGGGLAKGGLIRGGGANPGTDVPRGPGGEPEGRGDAPTTGAATPGRTDPPTAPAKFAPGRGVGRSGNGLPSGGAAAIEPLSPLSPFMEPTPISVWPYGAAGPGKARRNNAASSATERMGRKGPPSRDRSSSISTVRSSMALRRSRKEPNTRSGPPALRTTQRSVVGRSPRGGRTRN
jgi:hypothetical protein